MTALLVRAQQRPSSRRERSRSSQRGLLGQRPRASRRRRRASPASGPRHRRGRLAPSAALAPTSRRTRRRPPAARGRPGTSASRSVCRPTWVMVPSCSSATLSASSTVDARCATTMPVAVAQHRAQRRPPPAPRCARRARTGCRRAPGCAAGRARPGRARAAGAGRRTATCPARRYGCRGPRAGRATNVACATSSASRISASVASGRPSARFSRALMREQGRLLERGGHHLAQARQRQVAHVDAVDGDPPGGDVAAAAAPAR